MALTPETLPRHELNGLWVRVVESTDPGRVGIDGRVVVETTNTLHVEDRENGAVQVRQVPKAGTTFEFALPDDHRRTPMAPTDAAGPEATEYVTVEGDRLAARPARRTERTGDPRWR